MSIVSKTTETMAQVHSFVPAGKGLDTHFATLTTDKRDKTTKIIMHMVKLLWGKEDEDTCNNRAMGNYDDVWRTVFTLQHTAVTWRLLLPEELSSEPDLANVLCRGNTMRTENHQLSVRSAENRRIYRLK